MCTVIAGPGFGKTSLLASRAGPSDSELGVDLWLTCEPADTDADHLRPDLARTLGLDETADTAAIVNAVWSLAPRPVTLVFDDVHEVPEGSGGAGLLADLLDELPANAHVVLASRTPVPVPTARLAAAGQLVRILERDLLFDDEELASFAAVRGVPSSMIASSGGWAALTELIASAGADLVYDYLWEEVLRQVGDERARRLARFALVGGGDDDIATAVCGHEERAADLTAGLPLVQRSERGVALHALWAPPLRSLLSAREAEDALIAAAQVHRRRAEPDRAVELYAEAEDWTSVLAVMRDAAVHSQWPHVFSEHRRSVVDPAQFSRWYAVLPAALRDRPAARLAAGIMQRRGDPAAALPDLDAAAAGFRQVGDLDGEAATLAAKALVLMWTGDLVGLLTVHARVIELAEAGSPPARGLHALGIALVAHLGGDSEGVHRALRDIDIDLVPDWESTMRWFESVALRRDGDLDAAIAVADRASHDVSDVHALHLDHAAVRARWLRGEVDAVCVSLADLERRFVDAGDDFNAKGVAVELAAKLAWLGDNAAAARLLEPIAPFATEALGPMPEVMWAIARASSLVAAGEESAAAGVVRHVALRTVGTPDGWYWRDRGATALVHLLVPETRAALAREPVAPCHAVAVQLAELLEAARRGEHDALAQLVWPDAGVVRSCLALPWIIELAAAANAVGNPPPWELTDALGARLRDGIQQLAEREAGATVSTQAASLLARLPHPQHHVRIEVLGPLRVLRDDEPATPPELRRQRVRDLLAYVVAHRRVRREQVTEALWPDLDDGGRNLRVTLTYLQRVLEPEREDGAMPSFLRSEGPWLVLEPSANLAADVWDLERHLDAGARADASGTPGAAIDAYLAALPLWRGEPFADQPYDEWAEAQRVDLRARFTAAARRAGALLLAADEPRVAATAAEAALRADTADETAHLLLVQAHLAAGDPVAARSALASWERALAALGLTPSPLPAAVSAALGERRAPGERSDAGTR